MVNENYAINIFDVYVGRLVSSSVRYEENGEMQVIENSWIRNVLFTFDGNHNGLDLLDNACKYQVVGFTPMNPGIDDEVCVVDACNLGNVLSYLGFGLTVSYNDLQFLVNTFFRDIPRFYEDGYESIIDRLKRLMGYPSITDDLPEDIESVSSYYGDPYENLFMRKRCNNSSLKREAIR